MFRNVVPVLLLLCATIATAQVTPAGEALKEDGITKITCAFDGKPITTLGGLTVKPAAGEYHYDLYIPPGYNVDPKEQFPCLFVFDPSGKAKLGNAAKRLKRDRIVGVMLQESKNGPWEPIVANFVAAHDDVIKRVRIAEGFKFLSGFSGGARASGVCSQIRPGFSGIVQQGAMDFPGAAALRKLPTITLYATFGNKDSNRGEPAGVASEAPTTAILVSGFPGTHQWAPEANFESAFDWMDRWVYLTLPTNPKAMPLYIAYFKRTMDEVEKTSTDFEKYELLERAQKLADVRRLSGDKSLATQLADVHKRLKDLAKDPAIHKELTARDAFEKVAAGENTARLHQSADASKLASSLKQAAAAYTAVAEKYADTAYGARAKSHAEEIEAEVK